MWVYFFAGGFISSWQFFLSDKILCEERDLLALDSCEGFETFVEEKSCLDAEEVEACLVDDVTAKIYMITSWHRVCMG